MTSKKQLTLRGTVNAADNAIVTDHQIFSYEANDLTKGWVLKEAYMWPATSRANTGANEGHLLVSGCLTTDTIGSVGAFDPLNDVDDNRQVAWANYGFNLKNSSVSDFIVRAEPGQFLIDPNTVVASGLYLNFYTTSSSTWSPTRTWNYLIILEPKKLDPKETILHLIKNYAQDVSN